ncbi:MAG: hypothetical protein P8N02_04520 [Actinomycetota bacterium]|nr:hypothetical protein [Actinomycetota bacterium]
MTQVVLLGLTVMWAVLLVPGWVRGFRERSGRQTTIDTFHHQLGLMGRGAPGRGLAKPPGARLRVSERFINHKRPRSTVPQDAKDASLRRRDILVLLSVVAVVTLVGWLVSGLTQVGIAHAIADVLLGTYVYLLVLRRRAEAERMAKVHYLPRTADGGTEAAPEASKLFRRPAN